MNKLILLLLLGLSSWQTNAALPLQVDGSNLPSLAPMLEQSMPAVVNISTSTNVRMQENPLMNDPIFRRFSTSPTTPSSNNATAWVPASSSTKTKATC